MAGVLEGIRVVEMTQGWASPGAGMYLADQGAEVIKVEPIQGDQARRFFTYAPLHGEDRSFQVWNRNKRGIAVDLRHKRGQEIIYKLVERADVFVENLRPGVAERLGVDYEKLRSLNPRLICASLSGFGSQGPLAGQPVYDALTQALTGIMAARRYPDGTPMSAGVWVADCSTPMVLAYGITLALLARERTGRGQRVETALLNQAVAMSAPEMVRGEEEAHRPPQRYASQALMGVAYRCGDDEYLTLVAPNDDMWQRLCLALGLEELARDPEFDDPLKRALQGEVLYTILTNVLATKSREEWLNILRDADVPCAPILSREEAFHHPQLVENEAIVKVEHPSLGRLSMMGVPVRLMDNPPQIRRPAPSLGQHTTEVLTELGYSEEEISTLSHQGVIR